MSWRQRPRRCELHDQRARVTGKTGLAAAGQRHQPLRQPERSPAATRSEFRTDHRKWRGGWRGRLFRRPANLARAGEGTGGGLWGGAKKHKEIERIGGCGRGGGCPGSPEQQRRGLGSGRTMRSARRRGIERSGSTSTSGPRGSAALTSGRRRRRRSRSLNRRRSVARADQF